jgi:hypothetical protein
MVVVHVASGTRHSSHLGRVAEAMGHALQRGSRAALLTRRPTRPDFSAGVLRALVGAEMHGDYQ